MKLNCQLQNGLKLVQDKRSYQQYNRTELTKQHKSSSRLILTKADGPRSVGRGRRSGIRPQSPSITPSTSGKNSTDPRRKRSRIAKRQKWGVR